MSPDSPPFRRIAVIGVGLIGGSVAAAARERGIAGEIVGVSAGDDAQAAFARGLIDAVSPSVEHAVDEADLVVVAAPVPAFEELFARIASVLPAGALLTDTASTKRSVIAAGRSALGEAFARFVPAHPIAGSERRGAAAASAALFEDCTTILCPQPETDAGAIRSVGGFWGSLGARVVEMSAPAHDGLFAEVSHWPHAAVYALCGAIARGPRAADAQRLAGPGLRDSTRIGAASPQLWADILLDNREAVLECADAFGNELRALLEALRSGNRAALLERLEVASRWRNGIG